MSGVDGDTETVIRSAGTTAYQIAAICKMVVRATETDPALQDIAFSVEGVAAIANRLSDDLCNLAETIR